MSNLVPSAQLEVGYISDLHGLCTYTGDSISWDLPSFAGQGLNSSFPANFVGLVLDPTNTYIIQQPINDWKDADSSHWTFDTSGGATFNDTVHPQTGKKAVRQTNGTAATTYTATHNYTRPWEVGLTLALFWAETLTPAGQPQATGTNYAMYIEINANRQGLPQDPTLVPPGYRIAIESGKPIRLEGTLDDVNWTVLDVANELGDVDNYLKLNNREIVFEVFPMSDYSWWLGQPQSSLLSDAPPDTLVISINSGAALLKYSYPKLTFPGGNVRIKGIGGQWACYYADRRYLPAGVAYLPEQVRFRPFQTQPKTHIVGYAPYSDWGYIAPVITAPNKAAAILEIATSPSLLDADGYAVQTVMISEALLDFPRITIAKQAVNAVAIYKPVGFVQSRFYDQATGTIRTHCKVRIEDNDGLLSPNNLIPAARAARLYRGITAPGYDDRRYSVNGRMGLDPTEGYKWFYEGKRRFVEVTIDDRLRLGDPDLVKCDFALPFDGQCHYYAIRQLGYKLGFIDEDMNFPVCGRDSQCPHYHLPQGTNADPVLRPQPTTPVGAMMLQIRQLSGEPDPLGFVDPATGNVMILPMTLYVDPTGVLQYFPMPVGVARTILDPSLNILVQGLPFAKTFSAVPQFSGGVPALNEFIAGTMQSTGVLANIRTPIVTLGLRPTDGSFVYGYASNPALGSQGNPGAFGYLGIDIPYYHISKYYTTPEAALQATRLAAIQMGFPSIGSVFTAHMQAGLDPLSIVGVLDPFTQGSSSAVPYYITGMQDVYKDDGMERVAVSEIHARLLGQAA